MSSESQQVSIKTVNLNKSKVCRTPLALFYFTLTPKLLAKARPTSRTISISSLTSTLATTLDNRR